MKEKKSTRNIYIYIERERERERERENIFVWENRKLCIEWERK